MLGAVLRKEFNTTLQHPGTSLAHSAAWNPCLQVGNSTRQDPHHISFHRRILLADKLMDAASSGTLSGYGVLDLSNLTSGTQELTTTPLFTSRGGEVLRGPVKMRDDIS